MSVIKIEDNNFTLSSQHLKLQEILTSCPFSIDLIYNLKGEVVVQVADLKRAENLEKKSEFLVFLVEHNYTFNEWNELLTKLASLEFNSMFFSYTPGIGLHLPGDLNEEE